MERRVSEVKRRFLADESREWVERGLISEFQRGGILECYAVVRRLPTVVLTLGLLMIGIGILSFIAANWQVIPDWLKIAIIIGCYLADVGGAYYSETKGRRGVSGLLLFLSGFLLLGALALISQVFHVEGSASGLLAVWLLVYAPTFLIVRNISIYMLYEIVVLVYVNMLYFEYFDSANRYGFWDEFRLILGPWQPFVLLILLVGLAWQVWADARLVANVPGETGESKIKRFFVGGSTRRIFLSNFLILNWFTWMCVLNSTQTSFLPYVLSVLVAGALIGFMAWKLDAPDLGWQSLLLVGASGLTLTFPWAWYWHDGHHSGDGYLAPVLSSVALGAYLVYRIMRRQRGGGFSVFLFCVLLARWYFNMFETFTSKSLFFVTGGVILLLIAFAYKRWNKISGEKEVSASEGGDGDEIDD